MSNLHFAAAVVVPCSGRKTARPRAEATAVSIPIGSQTELENAWIAGLQSLAPCVAAGQLYAGRNAKLARSISAATGAPLFFASAGLGLVAAKRKIPSYGLTVNSRGPESISARVAGLFDPAHWWAVVSTGTFATVPSEVFGPGRGAILVALTRPYAAMLSQMFEELPDRIVRRLRITGAGLDRVFAPRLAAQVLPYDRRLDTLEPGTRADFPLRALAHFAERVLPLSPEASVDSHSEAVLTALAGAAEPDRKPRGRRSDEELKEAIRRLLPAAGSMGRVLRSIRDEGIACEQSRCGRLYRAVLSEGAPR
ncbi:hypothetical protein [Roseomonas indoligenes]|uniref:Uncharacterized protein n=1 Tax=Roseomonas indoligenes TaxID=2820811 RepID=A0A940MXU5_9PROT|nr:hypothetical protein [Pararoseomonas indoligenes]MBP0496263.1 hypothetical protein [Pararoseomonas indoligenes]